MQAKFLIVPVDGNGNKTHYDAIKEAKEVDERYEFARTIRDLLGVTAGWRFILKDKTNEKTSTASAHS